MQADPARNIERTGHDGGVRSATPQISGDAEDKFSIHRRGVRRREIMRDENVRLSQSQECFWRFALEIANDPASHVLNVESALAQVRIVDFAECLGVVA